MKKNLVTLVIVLFYAFVIAFVVNVLYYGYEYYLLSIPDRPHHALHAVLKPGGLYGHGMGILGSIMILLLFLYSARKRRVVGLRFGKMTNWLNVHIFFGIAGPILITLHTAMKFNGIVSISYFSMLAVMFSGVLGRYIYRQIPRSAAGDELTLEQIAAQDQEMTRILVDRFKLSPEALRQINQISGTQQVHTQSNLAVLFGIFINDLKRPLLYRRLIRYLRTQQLNVPPAVFRNIIQVAKQKSLLIRKRAFLGSINRIFHYWHVIHKPFAYVMIIIMFLHIFLTILVGYRWIF